MRKFKWRLQRILELKRKEKNLKKNELLKVTEKLVSKQSELLVEKLKLKRMADEIGKKDASTRIEEQQLFMKYVHSSNELISGIKGEIEKLEQIKKEKISKFQEIQKSKESLEKLREKARERFLKEQAKQQQKQIDENFAAIKIKKRVE